RECQPLPAEIFAAPHLTTPRLDRRELTLQDIRMADESAGRILPPSPPLPKVEINVASTPRLGNKASLGLASAAYHLHVKKDLDTGA
ncbi:unnamed protein product, partial [Amoebophrya sp. A25]